MTKKPLTPSSCKAVPLDRINELWAIFYRIDSAKKLLASSERFAECDCPAECYRDIKGPEAILADTLEKLERFLYELEVMDCGEGGAK